MFKIQSLDIKYENLSYSYEQFVNKFAYPIPT